MAQATRAKNDKPDTVYFDDWFVQVPLMELIGKTVYIEPSCMSFDWDKAVRKKIIAMGVDVVSRTNFNPRTCDYIVVSTGWMKTQKKYLTKEEKLAWEYWKKHGNPKRLYWKHIYDEAK